MKVKWHVAVIYIGLAIGAFVGGYAAKHRPLGPPASINQALKESRQENDAKPVIVYPSELPYKPRETAPPPAPKPRPHAVRPAHREPLPPPKAKPPLRHTFHCSRIPAVARGLDRDTIINNAPRYGLSSEQTEQVLRCLHK